MSLGKRMGAAAAVVTVALTVSPASAQPVADSSGGPRDEFTTVTLITGDEVTVRGEQSPHVRPAPGREGIPYRFGKGKDGFHVIPADAEAVLASGQVDRRLFDVSALIEADYDDRSRPTLPVLVSGMPAAAVANAEATNTLSSIGMTALSVPKATARDTWSSLLAGGAKVWLDGKRKATLDHSAAQIGAPEAWKSGLTGQGVKVAVLDTGVDQAHPDLKSREIAERNFTSAPDNVDRVGHGTHVASTIAGTGEKYKGVAHGAQILDGKVLNDSGGGLDSWIIAGMQWAAEQGADVVNMSLGGPDYEGVDPIEEAVNTLSAKHGTLFVIAAGNSGPARTSLGSPGTADAALTVGAVDRDDKIAEFSSRGPRAGGYGPVKPEITAPGVGISAARSTQGTGTDPGYVAYSGTSMATPHVAGAAALVAQAHPDWTGERIKAQLIGSAKPTPGLTPDDQGSGRVDVPHALNQAVTTESASLDLGTAQWPHDDDTPMTKTVVYRNTGQAPAKITLAADTTGPDGKPAPAGFLTLSATSAEIPAGATASVVVTVDPRAGSVDGRYSGTLTATGSAGVTRSVFSFYREVESYNLTVTILGPDGKPAAGGSAYLGNPSVTAHRSMASGSMVFRAPKSDYVLEGFLVEGGKVHHLAYPNLQLAKDTAVTLDSRETKPVDLRTSDPAATLTETLVGFTQNWQHGYYVGAVTSGQRGVLHTKHFGPARPKDQFEAWATAAWFSGDDMLNLTAFQLGTAFSGYDRQYRRGDLTTLKLHTEGKGAGAFVMSAWGPLAKWQLGFWGKQFEVPTTSTAYVTAENTTWMSLLLLFTSTQTQEYSGFLASPMFTVRPGTTREMRYGRPILSPNSDEYGQGSRTANVLILNPNLFGDAAGNTGMLWTPTKTELFRDGVKVGTVDDIQAAFRVPAERSDYRVTVSSTQSEFFTTSTRVDAAWTFTSEAGTEKLAMGSLRFNADLGADHTAPAGKTFTIPVTHAVNGKKVRPRDLTVDVSYDEGATWRKARIVGGDKVVLNHPKSGTVSLRGKASDDQGNTTEITVYKAYALGEK